MRTIGFIGIGVMGKSMANHLIDAGYDVHIYNRTKKKAEELLEKGAHWHESVASVSQVSDCIMTMVGYPSDVEAIYFGKDGIIENAKANSLLIDFTTSKPSLSKKIAVEAKKVSLNALDAPVSGGDIGAKNKTLTIMVGGEKDVFKKAEPLLTLLGKNIVLQGPSGAGQHTKMCNQITIASNMIGVTEAILYAQKSGLNPTRVLESISKGAAGSWSLENLAPRMILEDTAPGFYIKHFIKDMQIAKETADEMGLKVPGLTLALSMYQQLSDQGLDELGTQALYLLYNA
ncbi:putative oxidoreductase YkwC [Halolactibacillus alkaliphilus]|uniref:Putative oxidoreductase YkwC n=1 Tax=Halolactibacillus alkaliphilus TaxID=442899 RepID=A0A511X0X6_9BACI|nr:NAD(P)-dependent oxidoreductase [Halolactibacillus alkaliphilus]GEN56599.1 putative oxidoreductase YkwC [Halolactibacillus alkaliphilus]GGN69713.1 putative oxidoreductase YkwC [Halolactibacillus alkaliphilus]SFO76296.1 3-hydroxyisobutyrate dehydrogenase [Halolactibacillus alkaliphilus]